ncbi:MAG: heavy metal translocating P-type ATPase [Deltaproteobacteria bacterium]
MSGMLIDMDKLMETSLVRVDGLDCADCAAKLEKAVQGVVGVAEAELLPGSGELRFKYDPALTGVPQVIRTVESLGYAIRAEHAPVGNDWIQSVIRLEGLDCADCAAKLEKRIGQITGVREARVNFAAGKLNLKHYDVLEEVIDVIDVMGYHAVTDGRSANDEKIPFWKNNRYMQSTLISGGLLLLAAASELLQADPIIWRSLYVLAVLLGGYLPARAGLNILLNARELDMNILMSVAVLGALGLGQYQEAAVVVFLFALGNAIQALTFDRTRNSIRSLMELAPAEAMVKRGEQEMKLPVGEIKPGEIVIIRPGERIAVDGLVQRGQSSVNQAAITGESIPVSKVAGDKVFAGTINERGMLEVEVTSLARDNTVARIIELVEEAEGEKAPAELLIDRFARYYTPIVMGVALLVAVVPPWLLGLSWHKWLYEALGMLLVSCPCALVISTPVAIVAAIGSAARRGVLIKGGVYLEKTGQVSAMAFDKTGTLTRGQPAVTDIIPAVSGDQRDHLTIAASIEARSEHPLGQAIVSYARRQGTQNMTIHDFEAVPGQGVRASIEGKLYLLGSPGFLERSGVDLSGIEAIMSHAEKTARSVALLADEQRLLAGFIVGDVLREDSAGAIGVLHKAGIRHTIMLTGDNEATARSIAAQTGVDEFRAGLLPEDKVAAVRELLQEYGTVAMVGDGVNDAPALALSTVGIAMGAAGTDAALETADIALMGDDLFQLAYAIRLSRKALRIIKENIAFSLIFKAAILLLVIPGWLTLWLAVVGDMGTTLLVTLNGIRLLRVK